MNNWFRRGSYRFLAVLPFFLVHATSVAQPPRNMVVDLPNGRFVGLPIHWGRRDAALLESSGHIRVFDLQDVGEHRVIDQAFQPLSLEQAQAALQAELGASFETLVTGPYVIGAPRGEVRRWESRFRALLAGYTRYFEVRGWSLRNPDFPLVIVVLPSRAEFVGFAANEIGEGTIADNLVGMYVPRSNRCALYQRDSGSSSTDWDATELTIVHEAIHQLAYNTGVHERLFQHPLWFVEGLATMFEVPAVYDSRAYGSTLETRIHAGKRESLQRHSMDSVQWASTLQSLVADDELFRTQPEIAYAASWALTFYLVERMPREYFDFISRQRQRGFQPYVAGDREWDFRQAFSTTPSEIAPQVLKLLE